MRYLGIDYGTKRVGLALSDQGGVLAFPYKILKNDDDLISTIKTLCGAEGVEVVVVGESLDFNDQPNKLMGDIGKFIKDLKNHTDIEVNLQKEFMTTVTARQQPGGSNTVDASAAALILQRYLDKTNNKH